MKRPTGEAIDAIYEEFTTDNGPETSLTQRRYVFRTEDLCIALIEARAQLARIEQACIEVAPCNHAPTVGDDAVNAENGRYVIQDEDGEPVIDVNTPEELIFALSSAWSATQDYAEQLRATVDRVKAVQS